MDCVDCKDPGCRGSNDPCAELVLSVEERIKRWREEPTGEETEDYISVLCDAEEELRSLRFLVDERVAAIAYLKDRAAQYDQGSGIVHAIHLLIDGLGRGEHMEAFNHGELDDLIRCIPSP